MFVSFKLHAFKALHKCYKCFAKNVSILILSGFREDLLGVTTFPDVLKKQSL